MNTLFELTTEISEKDDDVIVIQAIILWSKVPKIDGSQCCEKKCSFRWIHHLWLSLKREMFSLEEEELIFTLHVMFELKRDQIATQLIETSQDRRGQDARTGGIFKVLLSIEET
ncbi:hypothetical protein H5410_037391 [Solanum commersonii]|uniref:Uncharacterized protein n=1 Tax=Solanum commersonii TaxID=4109 RepID=A0A9J5Y8C7_SOLCO|nr:hypothetical protein H5410_037391 [Solanum commersonii]